MRTFVETFADTRGISEKEALEQLAIAADVCDALSEYVEAREPYATRTIATLDDARRSIENFSSEET